MRNKLLVVCFSLSVYILNFQVLAQQNLLPVRIQGKWGCIDGAGKLIIPADYEYIGIFKNNKTIAQKNGLLGVIDTEGKTLLPFEHLNLDTLTANFFATRSTAGKWGIIKINGELITPIVFDHINTKRFRRSNATIFQVHQSNKIGAYSAQGKLISPADYDECDFYTENLIQRKKDGKVGMVDTTGKEILPTQYEAFAPYQFGTRFFYFKKDKKVGLMNNDGKTYLPCEYDYIKNFEQNPTIQNTNTRNNTPPTTIRTLLEASKTGKKGLFDMDLNEVIPVSYHFLQRTTHPDLFLVGIEGKGLYDTRAKREVISCLYSQIILLNQEVALLRQEKNGVTLTGAYNLAKQKMVIPILYNYLQSLSGGGQTYFLTSYLKGYNFFNQDGQMILQDVDFDDVIFDEAGTFLTRKGTLWGIVGNRGALVPTFEAISVFKNNLALVKLNNLFGLINIQGQIVLGTQYSEIKMRGQTARVSTNNSTEIITFDKEGNVLSRDRYAKMKSISIKKNKDEDKKADEWEFDLNERRTPVSNNTNNQSQATAVNNLLRLNGIPTRSIATFTVGALTWAYPPAKNLWTALKGKDTLIKPTFNYINELPALGLTQTVFMDYNPNDKADRLQPFWGLLDNNTGKYVFKPAMLGIERTQELITDFERGEVGRTPAYYLRRNGRIINNVKYTLKNKPTTAYMFYCHSFDTLTNLAKFNVGGYAKQRSEGLKQENIVGGKWGLINRSGDMIAAPLYTYIIQRNSLYFVGTEQGMGVLDSTGKEIIPCEYSKIDFLPSLSNPNQSIQTYLFLQKNNRKYGFLDSTRTIVIDATYKKALHFQEGFAPVMIDSLFEEKTNNKIYKVRKQVWTFINPQGQTIHPFAFSQVQHFSEGLAAVKVGNQWGYLNPQGQIAIQPIYTQAQDFHEGKAVVYSYKEGGTFYIDHNGTPINAIKFQDADKFQQGVAIAVHHETHKTGIINEKGEWITKPTYFSIKPFNAQGYALYQDEAGWAVGLLNKAGKELTKAQYHEIHDFVNGYAKVKQGVDWNFIDTTGKLLLNQDCQELYNFEGNIALAKDKEGFWGYLNKKGQWQIKPQFERASPFEKAVAQVKKRNDKSYFIDTLGNETTQPENWYTLNDLNEYEADSLLRYVRVERDGRIGYWDKTQKKIFIYPSYRKASPFYNGYAKITDLRGNIRYISEQKQTLPALPNGITWYNPEEDNFKIIRKNGLYGFATKSDFIFSEPKFAVVGELQQNRLPVAINALYGVADRAGKVLIAPIYERVVYIGKDIFRVELNDQIGYWSKTSGWIWQARK